MFIVPDENTIKLYTANTGNVWYSQNIGPPIDSGQQLDAFLLSSVVSGIGLTVRVLGLPQNAELIAALYLRRHKGEVRAVELAGQNVLHSREEMLDPELVLQRMRSVEVAPVRGGWHVLSVNDYPIYAMLGRMLRNNFVFDDLAQSYLHIHPAYKALQFIPTLDDSAIAQLLTNIIDPRWYVDRRSPDRAAKLELYLGLTPHTQSRVSEKTCLLTRAREFRCANVLLAWKTQSATTVNLNNPANFLYRIHAAAGGSAKGDLRASQNFIGYLRHNWLSALENRAGAKDGLFAPDLFFKTPAECAAYNTHMLKRA